MKPNHHGQMSESFLTAVFLSLSGGLQDAYTYLFRGKVFANAQTGNIVLLSANLMDGNWGRAVHYLVPLCAFALGVLTAEKMMKKLVKDAGLEARIEIDSAGITGYHEGDRADSRMRAHAARRGYSLDSISRPVRQWDFHDFDLIIGMDDQNITDLKRMAPDLESVAKIHRMTEFSRNKLYDHVPDPYYSGAEGFELVLDLLEDACAGLLEYCRLLRCPS